MAMNKEALFDGREFREIVANSAVTSHQFFREIQNDHSKVIELIREFARADYLVAKGFAQFLAHLISLVDKAEVRMLLIENLWDEHGSGNADEIHFVLYKRLLNSLEVSEPSVSSDSRAKFLQLQYDIADKSTLDGIAVFTYANEFLSMFEFSQIRRACKKHFSNVDEKYFQTNQEADLRHTSQLEVVMEKLVTSESQLESIRLAVKKALLERASFYDQIIEKVLVKQV